MTRSVLSLQEQPNRSAGLRIDRYFTEPGVHPYETVRWERTDIVLRNWRDGSINFEQYGAEFPAHWSQTARQIVASKYFRGVPGSPEREWSLKHLIDRVVDTYSRVGLDQGYFDSAEDADIFNHELKYMLVHQLFSFNSPVWFNVGTASPWQVSACYLLSVEDSMESILNWYREEGLIFKGGSGAGVNLSRIRGSGELLASSGGCASGPVSFMRGADASAGTIKSGGATRRAAKLVCLDADHPDIEDFVAVKAREERKIRALAAAGFDMDLGGEDAYSVQYQNANNSVRVSDAFLRAVDAGEQYALTSRVSGEPVRWVDARELFTRIAQAAWECADPGIQYDDTINSWHTCPESGRITTANPCLSGDTRLLTDQGLRRMDELADGRAFAVWGGSGRWAPAMAFRTGVRDVYRVTLSSGVSFRATEEHRVRTESGADVPVRELIGRKVAMQRGPGAWGGEPLAPDLAVLLGYMLGDGGTSNLSVYRNGALTTNREPEVLDYLYATSHAHGFTISTHDSDDVTYIRYGGFRELLEKTGFWAEISKHTYDRRLPEAVWSWDAATVRWFLCGLFSANGSAMGRYNRIALKQASKPLIQDVQRLLLALGFHAYFTTNLPTSVKHRNGTYVSRESYDLQIGSAWGFAKFQEEIGFLHVHKATQRSAMDPSRSREPRQPSVVSVEFDGTEEVFDFTEPETSHGWANGVCVHNCNEFMHVDNSSCNLASLNLVQFLRSDLSFDVPKFIAATELVLTAMDISIDFADFPTPEIDRVTRSMRHLGIGYSNLGALLMATGRAYDSDSGRALAASVTSLMQAVSYRRSAELASVLGPYDEFARNAEPHRAVVARHAAAHAETHGSVDDPRTPGTPWVVVHAADEEWRAVQRLAAEHGYRNAHLSVLAPVGTISFMMDCDTTGVEPDFALVKTKKTADGATIEIVNRLVSRGLAALGYPDEQCEAVVDYVARHGHVVGAPGLRPEHYEVFDCAVGDRVISPEGHLRMMAAVQPFLSGAISKTVNMPETATVEDVGRVYREGWRLGLKALAIYRDGCKSAQPLATKKAERAEEQPQASEQVSPFDSLPERHRLARRRESLTTSFTVGGAQGYLTSSRYPDNGLAEIFLKLGKQGSTLAGVMDAFSIAVSIGLQHGIPLRTFVRKFTGMQFEPRGMTDDPDVRLSSSLLDYVFRRLALDYLSEADLAELHIASAEARSVELTAEDVPDAASVPSEPERPAVAQTAAESAPLCLSCGGVMVRAGICYACTTCGATSGCS